MVGVAQGAEKRREASGDGQRVLTELVHRAFVDRTEESVWMQSRECRGGAQRSKGQGGEGGGRLGWLETARLTFTLVTFFFLQVLTAFFYYRSSSFLTGRQEVIPRTQEMLVFWLKSIARVCVAQMKQSKRLNGDRFDIRPLT